MSESGSYYEPVKRFKRFVLVAAAVTTTAWITETAAVAAVLTASRWSEERPALQTTVSISPSNYGDNIWTVAAHAQEDPRIGAGLIERAHDDESSPLFRPHLCVRGPLSLECGLDPAAAGQPFTFEETDGNDNVEFACSADEVDAPFAPAGTACPRRLEILLKGGNDVLRVSGGSKVGYPSLNLPPAWANVIDAHVDAGRGNDQVVVENTSPVSGRIDLGPGDDIIDSSLGAGSIRISCGSGSDTVRASARDVVASDCEHVLKGPKPSSSSCVPIARNDSVARDPTAPHQADIEVTANDSPNRAGCRVHVTTIYPSSLGARLLLDTHGTGVVYIPPHRVGVDTFRYKVVAAPGTSSIATVHVRLSFCRTLSPSFSDVPGRHRGPVFSIDGQLRVCFDGVHPPEIRGAPRVSGDTDSLTSIVIPFLALQWRIPLISKPLAVPGSWQFEGAAQTCFDFTGIATKPAEIAKAAVKNAAKLLASAELGDLAADMLSEFDALIPKACEVRFDPKISVTAETSGRWAVNFFATKSDTKSEYTDRDSHEIKLGSQHRSIRPAYTNVTFYNCSPWTACRIMSTHP